ncbi:MAG: hypothetical protein WDN31_14300 [Hyphomicrobium sp.]
MSYARILIAIFALAAGAAAALATVEDPMLDCLSDDNGGASAAARR